VKFCRASISTRSQSSGSKQDEDRKSIEWNDAINLSPFEWNVDLGLVWQYLISPIDQASHSEMCLRKERMKPIDSVALVAKI